MKVTRRVKPTEPEKVIPAVEVVEQPAAEPTQEGKVVGTDYQAIVQKYRDKVKSPKTAIRAKCVECMGGYLSEIEKCTATSCPLYPLRMGKNPFNKRTGVSRVPPFMKAKVKEDAPRTIVRRRT